MKLQESGENYLEAVLVLYRKNGFVRSVDIAHHLGVSKPSVSHAVMLLKNAGYITMDKITNLLSLTDTGRKIAENIYERHCFLSQYLMQLGVKEETALADACKIEHVISEETFQKMKESVSGSSRKTPQNPRRASNVKKTADQLSLLDDPL